MKNSMKIGLFLLIFTYPQAASGWGERGHDLIGRLAVRHTLKLDPPSFSWLAPKEHMIGHLSNVPDIVWRNGSKRTSKLNSPTHYIDVDLLDPNPSLSTIPVRYEDAKKLAKKRGFSLVKNIGTAPWRIEQLFNLAVESFKSARIAQGQANKPAFTEHVSQGILYLGLMSHFVGDLAQPLHTVKDYDGFDVGQGGVHAYFESDIVGQLPLTLEQLVMDRLATGPFRALVKSTTKARPKAATDAASLAIILASNSQSQVTTLLAIDKKHSLSEASRTDPINIVAKRKPAAQMAPFYQSMAVDRLAMAADALSYFFELALKKSGSPDFSSFFTFKYPVKPDFIDPTFSM